MEMLEHVPDPASVVRACATLVKPGGWVFFSTINRNPKSFLFAIVGAEYVLGCCPGARTSTRSSSGRASWRAGAATRGLSSLRDPGHGVQPADAALLAVATTPASTTSLAMPQGRA